MGGRGLPLSILPEAITCFSAHRHKISFLSCPPYWSPLNKHLLGTDCMLSSALDRGLKRGRGCVWSQPSGPLVFARSKSVYTVLR